MKHKIEIAPNLAIYIDGERVIGSKPHGLFLTTVMTVSDDDLKRLADRCLEVISDCKTEQTADDLIRKSDVLETYAELYDIFDDNKTIQEELHKVFDKINNIPIVESSNSEKPNNSTSSKMEQVDEPQYEMGMGTLKCDNCSEYGSFKCTKCDGEMYFKRLEPKDEPQTCDTCKYGEDKHRYAHICNECGVGINNYEPRTERNK